MRILTLILAITVCACANEDHQTSTAPAVITMGVLPDQTGTSLSRLYVPLVDYLESATALDIELSIPSDYQHLLDLFAAGRLDIANFGGITFIQAEQQSGAIPLVMRDVDLRFRSCYLVKTSEQRSQIAQFKGETFSFGPELSTSGHIMPRHFLSANGVVPERYFASVRYSSGHDQTAHWVSDGDVRIGVANCRIVQSMLDDGQLSSDSLRILETTPPYSDYVWATRRSLNTAVKNRLRDAFLALDMTDPEQRALLVALGTNGYLPAGRRDFNEVRAAARAVGLLDQETPN